MPAEPSNPTDRSKAAPMPGNAGQSAPGQASTTPAVITATMPAATDPATTKTPTPAIPADHAIVTTTAAPEALATVTGQPPPRQLSDLPKDELEHLAEDLGIDPTRHKTRQLLVAAVHQRRQLIAGMDRDAMLDVVRWGRRPVTINASKEQIAQEIARIKSMRFAGLSLRGLQILAKMRGVEIADADPVPIVIRKLKKEEGLFSKINRKRRSMIGSLVANIVGEADGPGDYKYLPPADGHDAGKNSSTANTSGAANATIKEEIEESGLFGGISNRIKKTADQYLNQKLDEIEARIDRKLDEIDRRLAEWRDKEIANRIRILKITLWASVIVGICSLIYSYVQTYWVKH
jgi:hypothetical protein